MNDMFNTTNDIELTLQRQKQGVKKGFPVFVVTVEGLGIELFFTRKGADEYIESLNGLEYKRELKYVSDVRNVQYEI